MTLLKKIFISLLLYLFTLAAPAYAYLDPGTGSFILQGFLALAASIIVFIKNPITMIKLYFRSLKKNKLDSKDQNK